MEEKKTHRLVQKPQMSVRSLADYMAASDQARRSVLRGCKYRAIARIVQHDEAKLAVSKYMMDGNSDPHILAAQSEYIRNKMADDDFERDCNEINADFVAQFATIAETVELPKGAQLKLSQPFAPQIISGVKITFYPDLLVERPGRQNTVKRGALMLRYQKDTRLKPEIGAYQSAAIHGMLCRYEADEDAQVDRPLCITLDAYCGEIHSAPSNAVSRFNNMKAACATISEAWDNLQPPKGAVL